jgi:hypothetical protein
MKKIMGWSIGVVLCFLFIIVGECAASRVNLVDEGIATVERVNSRQARVSHVSVYQDDKGVLISGMVRRKSVATGPDKGHVDVVVFSPDGDVLQEVIGRYTPRLTKNKRTARFSVRISTSLPQGCIVRVVHHDKPHNG